MTNQTTMNAKANGTMNATTQAAMLPSGWQALHAMKHARRLGLGQDARVSLAADGGILVDGRPMDASGMDAQQARFLDQDFREALAASGGAFSMQDLQDAYYEDAKQVVGEAAAMGHARWFYVYEQAFYRGDEKVDTVLVARHGGERYLVDAACVGARDENGAPLVKPGYRYPGTPVQRTSRGATALLEPAAYGPRRVEVEGRVREVPGFAFLLAERGVQASKRALEYESKLHMLNASPLVFRVELRERFNRTSGQRERVKVAVPVRGGDLMRKVQDDEGMLHEASLAGRFFWLARAFGKDCDGQACQCCYSQEGDVQPGDVFVGIPSSDACSTVYLDLGSAARAQDLLALPEAEHRALVKLHQDQYVVAATRRATRWLARQGVQAITLEDVTGPKVSESELLSAREQEADSALAALLAGGRVEMFGGAFFG